MAPSAVNIKSLIHENQRTHGFPKFADLLMEHPDCISELVDVATTEAEYPYPQYASWLLFHVARKDESLIEPFYNKVIDCILVTKNPSVLRSLLGVSLCFPLTEYEQGALLERLFGILGDVDSKPGLVYYSVRKLNDFLKLYPELQNEIKLVLEFRQEMNINPNIVAWSKTVFKKKRKDNTKKRD